MKIGEKPMNVDLDQLLTRLRNAPPDRPLDQIETRVWARIEGDTAEPIQVGAWGWRATFAAAMLVVGAFVGAFVDGTESADRPDSSPFSIHSSFAPSTLLEDGR